jgi:nitrogenase molybdenum-cofactor synthesis protein NifE
LLYTGGVKSWSIVSALQDLGMTVVATGTKKSTAEDKARIRDLMGEEAVMIDEGSPKALLGAYKDLQADILIAGGRNLYTALKARIPFLDINQEREFGYAGYRGMLELAKQLALSMESPVWEAVRRPAPWAKAKAAGTPVPYSPLPHAGEADVLLPSSFQGEGLGERVVTESPLSLNPSPQGGEGSVERPASVGARHD